MNNPFYPPELDNKFKSQVKELVEAHNLAVENLTQEQVVEIIIQMIKSGDFMRHVYQYDAHRLVQGVSYIPFREVEELKAKITKLHAELDEYYEIAKRLHVLMEERYGPAEGA